MNYKLREDGSTEMKYYSDVEGKVIDYLLDSRGVENADELLAISQDNVYHWSRLKGVDEASDLLIEMLVSDKEVEVGILLDGDMDGVTSTSVTKGYIKDVFDIDSHVLIHSEHRKHGLDKDDLFDGAENEEIMNKIDLLIIPDAGTSDTDMIEYLKEWNKDLIIVILD